MDNIFQKQIFLFSLYAGGIMEEAFLIGLKETKGTGKFLHYRFYSAYNISFFFQAQQESRIFYWFRILVWEDGYCDFYECEREGSGYVKGRFGADIFFKMSHEVYNFGEG